MPACHAGDRRFESGRVRHFSHPSSPAPQAPARKALTPSSTGRPSEAVRCGPLLPREACRQRRPWAAVRCAECPERQAVEAGRSRTAHPQSCSSVARAPRSHRGGRQFDPDRDYHQACSSAVRAVGLYPAGPSFESGRAYQSHEDVVARATAKRIRRKTRESEVRDGVPGIASGAHSRRKAGAGVLAQPTSGAAVARPAYIRRVPRSNRGWSTIIAEWSSGSSSGSYPEGRRFESCLRNQCAPGGMVYASV
jgi:hypothetical protein